MNQVGAGRVTVVAFDGIIADTLPSRAKALADALADALAQECALPGITADAHEVSALLIPLLLPVLPGRTFDETIAVAVDTIPALQHERIRHDLTMHDLIALRAQRTWSATAAHGVPLCDGMHSRWHTAVARGNRLVVRSDSQRRDVEPLLRLAGLDDSMLLLRCADDQPRRAGVSSLQASYDAIDARLERLRIPWTQRDAVEVPGGAAAQLLLHAVGSRYVLQADLPAKSL